MQVLSICVSISINIIAGSLSRKKPPIVFGGLSVFKAGLCG